MVRVLKMIADFQEVILIMDLQCSFVTNQYVSSKSCKVISELRLHV